MAIILQCNRCGMTLHAAESQRNTAVICPKCRSRIPVPPVVAAPPCRRTGSGNDGETSRLLPIILIAAAAPAAIMLLLLLIYQPLLFAMFVLALLGVIALATLYVLCVRSRAFGEHLHEVPLFFNWVRLVLWEPTQGVVLLKNKQITFVDDNVEMGGGVRFIFPVLGHEVGLVAPLTVLPVQFEDTTVYTRDSIPLSMKMTIWWKIHDLRQFYLCMSQELHTLKDDGRHAVPTDRSNGFHDPSISEPVRRRLETAERWIAASAEEETRTYTSGISTSLLVAEQIAASLPVASTNRIAVEPSSRQALLAPPANGGELEASLGVYQTASTALGERLQFRLNAALGTKGLEIDRIALQEIGLPPEVRQKAIDAAAAWYGALEARRKGVGAAARIDELAKVIGKDAAATAEILKHYKGTNIGVGLTGLLDQVFSKLSLSGK